ncbi:ABC transporter ATP-binding protein [Bradyrhizobium sp. HKCCYLS20291]|uniref:ABC transporter ATP-binding protein n=1 Tax=Bradyrhizobium sp. HKCCYLS20291 TaxID=3420766 RepID=UPI003EBF4CC6
MTGAAVIPERSGSEYQVGNKTSTGKPVLEIRNLTIGLPTRIDRRYAVRDFNLTVKAGEVVCLVGESGSGKSVTAFATMGLLSKPLKPSAGQILLEGEDVLSVGEARLRQLRCARMSMIFQEPMTALNPVLTCGRQIDEVLQAHCDMGPAARKAKIISMFESVRLRDAERIYAAFPHQLSGGQRQRIMIAMALVLDPVLLIADEPTTALDVTTQAGILKLISELQSTRGAGVLFITHDFGVVAEIAHRVAVLRSGELVEVGPTDQILSNPRQDYTKMLISSVPSLQPPAREPVRGQPIILRTDKLGKSYQRSGLFRRGSVVRAAANVDIEIQRGETLGIVGESGSGKSTVARCIARLIDPSEGQVFLGGTDVTHLAASQMRPHRRRVQIVFQDPYRSLNPRLTVGQSIIEGPVNFGMSRTEALSRAARLMETVQLDGSMLQRYPHQFSGGQRQRICIARALAMEPDLLIADEAVSALDVSVQRQVLQLLDDVRKRLKLAVLFITHDLRVAAQVCDRVAVMRQGEVVELGSTEAIFRDPQHDYTKSLFAAAPGRGRKFGEFITQLPG